MLLAELEASGALDEKSGNSGSSGSSGSGSSSGGSGSGGIGTDLQGLLQMGLGKESACLPCRYALFVSLSVIYSFLLFYLYLY
jgi:hypothetical protein